MNKRDLRVAFGGIVGWGIFETPPSESEHIHDFHLKRTPDSGLDCLTTRVRGCYCLKMLRVMLPKLHQIRPQSQLNRGKLTLDERVVLHRVVWCVANG